MTTEPTITFTPEPTTIATPAAPAPVLTSFEDPAAESEREEAFSAEFSWNGKTLQPLSLERYNIFVTQRVAMAAPPLGDALRDGGGFFPDAQRLLWLCSHPPELLTSLRRDPAAMQDAIEAWSAENAPLSRASEIIDTALQIFNAAFESEHQARPSNRRSSLTSGN